MDFIVLLEDIDDDLHSLRLDQPQFPDAGVPGTFGTFYGIHPALKILAQVIEHNLVYVGIHVDAVDRESGIVFSVCIAKAFIAVDVRIAVFDSKCLADCIQSYTVTAPFQMVSIAALSRFSPMTMMTF